MIEDIKNLDITKYYINDTTIEKAIHTLKLCNKYKFDIDCITPDFKKIVFEKQFEKFRLLLEFYNNGEMYICFDRKKYDTICKKIHINDIPFLIQTLKK